MDQIILPENPTDEELLIAALDAQDGMKWSERYRQLEEKFAQLQPPRFDPAEINAAVQKDLRDNLPMLFIELWKRVAPSEGFRVKLGSCWRGESNAHSLDHEDMSNSFPETQPFDPKTEFEDKD